MQEQQEHWNLAELATGVTTLLKALELLSEVLTQNGFTTRVNYYNKGDGLEIGCSWDEQYHEEKFLWLLLQMNMKEGNVYLKIEEKDDRIFLWASLTESGIQWEVFYRVCDQDDRNLSLKNCWENICSALGSDGREQNKTLLIDEGKVQEVASQIITTYRTNYE